MAIHYAHCCHPLPGERIVGIVTTGKGITVHALDCFALEKFNDMPEVWLEISWDREGESFVVRIGYGAEYIEEKYDEGMDWLQNTVYAGYEGTEGLLGAFAVDVGGKFVTLSNWDSQEALDASLESFQQIMADAQNYIKSPPTIVTGECSIWRNMASFPAGKLSEWSK